MCAKGGCLAKPGSLRSSNLRASICERTVWINPWAVKAIECWLSVFTFHFISFHVLHFYFFVFFFFWGQTFYVLAFQAIEAVMLSLASFLSACFVIEWPKDSGCMRLCQGPYSHYLQNQGRTTTTTVIIIASWQNDSGYCKAICVLPLPSFEFVIISWSMILRFIDLSPRGEVGCGGVGRWVGGLNANDNFPWF